MTPEEEFAASIEAERTRLSEHAEETEDPADRLQQAQFAGAVVLDDAIKSAQLGEWERVNQRGDDLAAIAEAIKHLATRTREALDAEWDTFGIDGWQTT